MDSRKIFLFIVLIFSAFNLNSQVFLTSAATDSTVWTYQSYIMEYAPAEDAFVAVHRLAERFIIDRDWDRATELYKEFKLDFPELEGRIDSIIALLKVPTENLNERNVGPAINTAGSEYSPVPGADDNTLYFTGVNRNEKNNSEDIYYAEMINGEWQPAQKLTRIINTASQEAPQCVTTDGNTIIIFGNYPGNLGKGDLYFSDRTATGWSEVQAYPPPINTEYFDCDAKMSNDGKALIFVSDRPGNIGEFVPYQESLFHGDFHGNTDIYVSLKTETGWSEPINLGSVINTPFAERKPFLHPDGRSLYFSSDGHYGLGRQDLFKATRLSDTSWTEWSRPRNLGKEVNTPYNERAAIISTAGEIAYFASGERYDTYGQSDIYTIDLPDWAKPEPVATIQGTVKDNNGNFIAADIIWENLGTGRRLGQMRSNPQNGQYFIVLPLGENYGFYAEKEGYFPISVSLDLRGKFEFLALTQDITLHSIADLLGATEDSENVDMLEGMDKRRKLRLNNLFFDYDKDNLKPESIPELRRVITLLNEHIPASVIEISGHTDNRGSDAYNENLSQRRAASVVKFLVFNGVDPERLVPKGYGEIVPIATNETDEGRALNRRVELAIIGKKK